MNEFTKESISVDFLAASRRANKIFGKWGIWLEKIDKNIDD